MIQLSRIRCFLLDMDGTFYLGNKILPGALDFMRVLAASRCDYLFFTNNSSCSAVYYADKLTKMGWPVSPDRILTSGEATALYLTGQKPGARIFLLGTPELAGEFAAHGLQLVQEQPDFVVLGFDKTLTYEKLEKACGLIRAGVPFVATHPDVNCPTENGFIPDCGAMIELIKASTGVSPYIIGKPYPDIIQAAFAKMKRSPSEVAVVGDRLYTDIATGKNAGITSILVLTGETQARDLGTASVRPDFIYEDLGAIGRALCESDCAEPVSNE
jgi:4-nitrophenyl phosphatase/NagD protein